LLAAALPHDREPLGVERELDAVVRAFKARELGGDVVIESFPRATLAALRERLDAADRPCHVVHFIGHAGFAAASREGVLVFEDDGGGSRAVGARQLGPLLLDHDALQLLVLNSCWGARAPREGGSPGLAQALMRQRVPAVIAMQTCIDDTAAIAFAKHFYSALAAGHAVDVALAGCRKGMASDGDGGGWAAPVVYLRAAPAPLLPAPRPPEGVVTQKSVRPVVAPPGASAALVSGVAGTRVRGRVSRAAVLGVVVLAVIAAAGGSWLAFELRGRPGLTPSASSATFRAAAAPTAASPTSEVPECSPVPEIAMKFMRLGPGTFLMGSPHGGAADERPAHYVTLSPFCVGAYEVTRGQWLAVMGSAATPGSRREDDLPMESVSWDDVQLFLGRLNDLAGRARYRLPTEAEWEYAARAGSGGAYSFGDDPGDLWRFGNCKSLQHDDGFDRAAPVGSFLPNRWGLYDLYGNVSEWVEDAYGRYGPDPVRDPHLREGSLRVRRGGSWAIVAKNCRSAFRNKSRPDTRKDDVGFRLVRLPD
jgi:formylglycine-generating enzyme required for sulfatase activity